jgi:spore germination cell wall hydrolase CwlJ-like protein
MGFFSAFGWPAAHWARRVRLFVDRSTRDVWLFVLAIGIVIALVGLVQHGVFADEDRRLELARQRHEQNVACLARNVYYEARGEPTAGQYAVAEVTMNRRASGRYPDSVCEVVYQRNWDPLRRRYVAAFSWTELGELDEPSGEAWRRAREVAETVYYEMHAPALDGSLFFHATYVNPSWSKDKRRVVRIGRHIFYK